jgi:hypothetical protein
VLGKMKVTVRSRNISNRGIALNSLPTRVSKRVFRLKLTGASLRRVMKGLTILDNARAHNRHKAGARINIRRTMELAKYMAVKPKRIK